MDSYNSLSIGVKYFSKDDYTGFYKAWNLGWGRMDHSYRISSDRRTYIGDEGLSSGLEFGLVFRIGGGESNITLDIGFEFGLASSKVVIDSYYEPLDFNVKADIKS